MYKILSVGEGRSFECALHFAVVDKNLTCPTLYAASFVGYPSAAWAIDAAIKTGSTVVIDTERAAECYPASGLRTLQKKVGAYYHILVLPSTCFGTDESFRTVVLAWDGDIKTAVGRYLAKKFSLPWEWVEEYYELFFKIELRVIADSEFPRPVPTHAAVVMHPYWRNENLTQPRVDDLISEALKNGRLKIPPSLVRGTYSEGMTLQEYLKANAGVFARQVSQVKPLHDPADGEVLNPAIAMDRIPYPAQAHAIAGLVKLLKKQKTAILCGDMGTGKSIVALGVANVLKDELYKNKGMSVVLTTPGVVVPKWFEQEIRATLPDAKMVKIGSLAEAEKNGNGVPVVTAAQYLSKVRAGHKPEGLEFLVMSIDRAKLGPPSWWCSALWKVSRDPAYFKIKAWHCPDCSKVLTKVMCGEKVPLAWDDFVESPKISDGLYNAAGYLKKSAKIKFKQKPPVRKCPECGAILLRPALKSRGETNQSPRWYAALVLKKLKKYFDLYIADEVHQTKAENSGRGFAFAELVKASKRTLCLTGTLVNGMSTSIKEILWRTDPEALIRKGFDHRTGMVGWASRYGVLERVTRIRETDDGIHTRRRRYQNVTVKEKPGISPELAADHLLHQAVFMELPDIGLPLVKIKEVPVFVSLDEEHLAEYKKFHNSLRETCINAYKNGNKGAFAKFIPSTINAVDRSDAGLTVEVDGMKCCFPAFGEDYYNAKERKLLQIIQENLAEGRGCFVYCNYTDRYDVHRRVEKVLKDHGIESAVLESYVSQEERVGWLAEQARKGTKVIICNMRLVETGLDLLPWPTLIFYQLSYDINTVRQASRRAWRIGQTREWCALFLHNSGSNA